MSFEAQYFSRCPECLERIEPGDEVVYNSGDEVVHVDCDDEDDEDFDSWGR